MRRAEIAIANGWAPFGTCCVLLALSDLRRKVRLATEAALQQAGQLQQARETALHRIVQDWLGSAEPEVSLVA